MSPRFVRSQSCAPLFAAALIASPTVLVSTALYSQQPTTPTAAQARPTTHTVKRGDTLWDIAKLYLGDSFLWPEIYRLNTDIIEDPHWIYPGELLKLPGEQSQVVAAAPGEPAREPVPTPAPERPAPSERPAPEPLTPPRAIVTATPPAQDTTRLEAAAPQIPTVRSGEFIAAPWIDQRGGPRGAGYLMAARDVPGIASADQSRLNLYDQVLVTPPNGVAVAERDLYLAYKFGPLLEDLGQVVIPTGIVRIARPPRNGDAAIGEVVKLFGLMQQGQHLIPLDSSASIGFDKPQGVDNGAVGRVRWVYDSPVLPTIQHYVVLDIRRQQVRTGDRVELFLPRQGPADGERLGTPPLPVATAQILRTTPYGSTAIIVHQQQPNIEEGIGARVTAKMP